VDGDQPGTLNGEDTLLVRRTSQWAPDVTDSMNGGELDGSWAQADIYSIFSMEGENSFRPDLAPLHVSMKHFPTLGLCHEWSRLGSASPVSAGYHGVIRVGA